MARLRVYQEIDNTLYKLTFVNDPKYLMEADKDLIRKYGEPEIQMGGVFLESTADEFTLPEKFARVRSDFPFTQEFDSTSTDFETNTVTKVNGYRDEIVTRFTAAFTDLRANTDTFTTEKVYDI